MKERVNKKEELEAYFRRRIKGKLIVFSNVKENIEVEKEEITVTCSAKKEADEDKR